MANQGFTAADMADQAAAAFERGRESVLAEQAAAAQEAVASVRDLLPQEVISAISAVAVIASKESPPPVQKHIDTINSWLYAAPVTAAPACLACEGRPSGENIPCAVCNSTPAAPGIDLRNAILHLRDDALDWEDPGDTVNAYDRVLRLIDANTKGGAQPVAGSAVRALPARWFNEKTGLSAIGCANELTNAIAKDDAVASPKGGDAGVSDV